MKLTNAIKRLGKLTEVKQNGTQFWGEIDGNIVEFRANGPLDDADTNARGFRVRSIRDEDDIMTDYFAGVWCDNLSQAIRLATR